MSEPLLVASHVGQSRAEVLCPRQGWTMTLPGVHTDSPLAPQFESLVRRTLEVHPDLAADGFVLAVGAAGARDDENAEEVMARVGHLGVRRLHLAHDSTTSYLGALGQRPGVVTSSDTGAFTLAVGAERVARVDGWGWIIGDWGSGFWIGRKGLQAVMLAHDGRGPATCLTEILGADFHDIEQAHLELQADRGRVLRIARYAMLVISAADQGDEVAAGICRDAARALAGAAATGLRLVGLEDDDRACATFTGGVMTSSLIHDAVLAEFSRLAPRAHVQAPAGSSLDGALLLPSVPPDTPLGRRIITAG